MDHRYILTLTAAASLLALAGCATTPPAAVNPAALQLAGSAETLDENARLLAARSDNETAGFAADAHELEQLAYAFHEAAASGQASDSELRAAFDKVTRGYETVHTDVERMDTQQAHADLDLVKDAYHDVASRMAVAAPANAVTPGS
ncbi:MAG: hypothetical protein ACLPQ6_16040 [Steroidobacteraceae bacterium]